MLIMIDSKLRKTSILYTIKWKLESQIFILNIGYDIKSNFCRNEFGGMMWCI